MVLLVRNWAERVVPPLLVAISATKVPILGIKGTAGKRPSRYREMYNLIEGPENGVKQVFMLTATPVNNRLIDIQHMIELFSRGQPDYFKRLGIHSLAGHART